MILDRNENKDVVVLLGAGAMGTAIVRRVAAGKKILLGDISEKALERVSHDLQYSGYDVTTHIVDACDPASLKAFAEKAASLGPVKTFVMTAGASPSQAKPEHIIALDLIGTAYAIDAFGVVMAPGGAGLVVASQTGYMPSALTKEDEQALAMTPSAELASLPCLDGSKTGSSGAAYIVAKRANQLRVQAAAATTWSQRRARINTLSPGIIVTPLAYDEFNAPGNTYQGMIDASPARRTGTIDEIAAAGAFLLGPDAGFITGTDLLIDGGVIASMRAGKFALGRR